MIIRNDDLVELYVEGLAFGGEGIARIDGFVVFVKGAIPNDRVLARIVKKKKDYANAVIVEMITPSSDRIKAPCPYHEHCGGCKYQHLIYSSQLKYKKEHVADSIKRIGGLTGVPVHDVIPSDEIYGYRNKMEFSFSDRPWVLPEQYSRNNIREGFALGLHVPGTFSKVIDMDACLIQNAMGNGILQAVKEFVNKSDLPVYNLKTNEGFWRFLTLRHSVAFNEWMVNIVTSVNEPHQIKALADILHERFPNIKTIVNNINSRKSATAVGEEEIVVTGEGYINEMLGNHTFRVSSNSFFQTNTKGAQRLYDQVLKYAGLTGSERVLDLFCGTGTIPIYLSGYAREILGMEIVESAVADAKLNCRINNISNCRFILGDIRDTINRLEYKPDLMIVDPPRTGIHKDIMQTIMGMGVERIVYVSCNPATMARDLCDMKDKYEALEIQPVDMFPHTYHIESVAKIRIKRE
jgi:23S rRNA (uracil1939-C5)-methyltransferase